MNQQYDENTQKALNYVAYKNGERDISKLSSKEVVECFILESELLVTAITHLYESVNDEIKSQSIVFATAPHASQIEDFDYHLIAHLCETFIRSKVLEANSVINKLIEGKDGAE